MRRGEAQSPLPWPPHLHSGLDAGLDDGACALNVDALEQRTVVAARGRRGTVEDQGHIPESWQQSLQRDRETSHSYTRWVFRVFLGSRVFACKLHVSQRHYRYLNHKMTLHLNVFNA